jgi:hypothetical protein
LPDLEKKYLDGIIARLTRQCGGNVHDQAVVEVISSRPWNGTGDFAANNVADLRGSSFFRSDGQPSGDISHTRNNRICYDFRRRRIVPTHYAVRSRWNGEPADTT